MFIVSAAVIRCVFLSVSPPVSLAMFAIYGLFVFVMFRSYVTYKLSVEPALAHIKTAEAEDVAYVLFNACNRVMC